MKKFITAVMFMLGSIFMNAQSYSSNVEYNGSMQPALVLNVPYSVGVAEGTIIQKLKENGYNPETKGILFWKKNKVNDFYQFQGVQLPMLNNQNLDLYFNVERKTKKDKNNSIVYMMVSKGYDNFLSENSDVDLYFAAKRFLNSFVSETAEYKLNLEIEDASAKLKSAEKDLSKMESEQKSLESKLEKIKKEIIDQQRNIEESKSKLEELKAKQNF